MEDGEHGNRIVDKETSPSSPGNNNYNFTHLKIHEKGGLFIVFQL